MQHIGRASDTRKPLNACRVIKIWWNGPHMNEMILRYYRRSTAFKFSWILEKGKRANTFVTWSPQFFLKVCEVLIWTICTGKGEIWKIQVRSELNVWLWSRMKGHIPFRHAKRAQTWRTYTLPGCEVISHHSFASHLVLQTAHLIGANEKVMINTTWHNWNAWILQYTAKLNRVICISVPSSGKYARPIFRVPEEQ